MQTQLLSDSYNIHVGIASQLSMYVVGLHTYVSTYGVIETCPCEHLTMYI